MVKEGEIIYQFEDKKGDRQLFHGKDHQDVSNKNKK
jgi:hypothetical protein